LTTLNPMGATATSLADTRSNVSELGAKLWGGFSTDAKADLEAIRANKAVAAQARIGAAWQLARWAAFHQCHEEALNQLGFISFLVPDQRLRKRHLLLECESLLNLGRFEEAAWLVAAAVKVHGYDTDVCLLSANLIAADAQASEIKNPGLARLAFVNRIFSDHGFDGLRLVDPEGWFRLDNLASDARAAAGHADGPTVSIVMPAYNAAGTIRWALGSLRAQTWGNLEILVVDDASSDGTPDIVMQTASVDDRVRLIRNRENAGCYASRNIGAGQASGAFVTTHDADDWSHPQKIQTQVERHLKDDVVATMTHWVRVTPDFRFLGPWRAGSQLVETNHSSLMVGTAAARALGGWDPVRFGADTEFIKRLQAAFGESRTVALYDDVPLSFGLAHETSLTNVPTSHVRSKFFGVRKEYRRAYGRWHRAAQESGDFRITDKGVPRRFPAPLRALSASPGRAAYDVVFVTDFAAGSETSTLAYADVVAAARAGLRVGVFHWPAYDRPIDAPIDDRIAELIDRFQIGVVDADAEIEARRLILYGPGLFEHRIDRVPNVVLGRMMLIDGQPGRDERRYDAAAIQRNLTALFGTTAEWLPASDHAHLAFSDPVVAAPSSA
jgi:glycosyltransferase involved in cell wall biosynthesis